MTPTIRKPIIAALALPIALALFAAPGYLKAEEPVDPAVAVSRTRDEVEETKARLREFYRRSGEETRSLLQRIREAEAEAERLRREARQVAEETERLRAEQTAETAELERIRAAGKSLADMALEFRGAYDAMLGTAEAEMLAPTFARIDSGISGDSVTPEALETLLEMALQHGAEAVGGTRFRGNAALPDGTVVAGRLAKIGPLTYFAADGDGPAGIAAAQPGNLLPALGGKPDAQETAAIRALVLKGSGRVPFDVTGGSALQVREAHESLVEHLVKGGPIIVPLLLLGTVCLVLAVVKYVSLLLAPDANAKAAVPAIARAAREGNTEEAYRLAGKLRKPLDAVIRIGLDHRNASKEHLEEILYEQLLSCVPTMERFLTPLAVGASAAPLIGLLGTVTGMIHTFRLITVFGTGDAKLLSAGISEALITTEVGLAIAIPALLCHAYLSRKVRRTVVVTQDAGVVFVNELKLGGEAKP